MRDLFAGVDVAMPCPLCSQPTNGVRDGGKTHFDCTYCGRTGTVTGSTVEEETSNISNNRWWKIVRGGK
jgi:transposase-like protein